MNNSAEKANGVEQPHTEVDTPMESPEKVGKGKGKMAEEMPVDEDDDGDEDEDEDEGEGDAEPDEQDEDNMETIDTDNIVASRTRGKNIDYAQAAKEMPAEEGDDDDEEDEDFVEDEDDEMKD